MPEIMIEDKFSDTIPKIRMLLKSMTRLEYKVATYCIDRGISIGEKSIFDVANETSVSAALVVKVAKKCGFKGFKDFKNALVLASNAIQKMPSELNSTDTPEVVIQKVFNTAIVGLKDTASVLNPKDLVLVAEKIIKATKIDIYGSGGSGAVAMDLYHKMMRIMIRSELCTDVHMMMMSAVGLDKKSVAIGISHSGQSRGVVDALNLAHSQGAFTIAITNNMNSPICQNTDISFCSVAQSSPIVGENAAARIAMLNIIDVLFVLVASKTYDETILNIEKTIESARPLRVGFK